MSIFIGLMSGTSMDGIDAALVDVSKNQLLSAVTCPYSVNTQQLLKELMSESPVSPAKISQANTIIGREFAAAAIQLMQLANILPEEITAIGSHGQTICHDAMSSIPYTMQLGCAHTIAELTRVMVVADFRTRDMVLGGQGAPFAPIYHQALLGQSLCPTAMINIGGIANLTYFSNGHVFGYDVGPGNCLMDEWTKKHLNQSYDIGGHWAKTGRVIQTLLMNLQSDPYFQLPPPKSIGKEYFSLYWLEKYLEPEYEIQDVQATLLELTATLIAQTIRDSETHPQQALICGGGAHNETLLNAISLYLPTIKVASTQLIGIDPDYLEAMMFAWLADKTVNQVPIDLTSITGASHSAILGAIYAKGL